MAENDSIRRALSRGMKTLMSQKAFDRITVSDICRASAVSRRTFYRYFQDKYDLLNFVHYDEFSRFFEDKQTAHALEIYPAACRHMYENRMFYVNAFSVTGQGSFREFCMERLYVYLERDYGSACETDHDAGFISRAFWTPCLTRCRTGCGRSRACRRRNTWRKRCGPSRAFPRSSPGLRSRWRKRGQRTIRESSVLHTPHAK